MADRMAVLSRGVIAQVGSPEEVYRNPHSAYVAHFIGETNLIDGTLEDLRDGLASVRTAGGTLCGRVSDPAWQPAAGAAVRFTVVPS